MYSHGSVSPTHVLFETITPSINGVIVPDLEMYDVIVPKSALDWAVTQGSSPRRVGPPPLCPSMAQGNDGKQQWRKTERGSTVSRRFIGAQFHSAPPFSPLKYFARSPGSSPPFFANFTSAFSSNSHDHHILYHLVSHSSQILVRL